MIFNCTVFRFYITYNNPNPKLTYLLLILFNLRAPRHNRALESPWRWRYLCYKRHCSDLLHFIWFHFTLFSNRSMWVQNGVWSANMVCKEDTDMDTAQDIHIWHWIRRGSYSTTSTVRKSRPAIWRARITDALTKTDGFSWNICTTRNSATLGPSLWGSSARRRSSRRRSGTTLWWPKSRATSVDQCSVSLQRGGAYFERRWLRIAQTRPPRTDWRPSTRWRRRTRRRRPLTTL